MALPKGSIFPRPKAVSVEFLQAIFLKNESYDDLVAEVYDRILQNQQV